MAVQGSLTTTFGISSAAPSAFTLTAYKALSFTDCGEVTNVGEFGRMYEMVRINNLKGGATRKFKGSYDNGTFELELLFDRADAGQTLIEALRLGVQGEPRHRRPERRRAYHGDCGA